MSDFPAIMNCTFEVERTSVQTDVKKYTHFGAFVQHYPFKQEEFNKVKYLHCWP